MFWRGEDLEKSSSGDRLNDLNNLSHVSGNIVVEPIVYGSLAVKPLKRLLHTCRPISFRAIGTLLMHYRGHVCSMPWTKNSVRAAAAACLRVKNVRGDAGGHLENAAEYLNGTCYNTDTVSAVMHRSVVYIRGSI